MRRFSNMLPHLVSFAQKKIRSCTNHFSLMPRAPGVPRQRLGFILIPILPKKTFQKAPQGRGRDAGGLLAQNMVNVGAESTTDEVVNLRKSIKLLSLGLAFWSKHFLGQRLTVGPTLRGARLGPWASVVPNKKLHCT